MLTLPGLDDSDRKGPALKRVLQDSPGGGGAVGLKGSQSMNAVPGSKPVSAQTHATQLISKRGTVGSDSHHSPLLPTGAAPLRPSSSSLSASTPLTFSSNTALSPSADKEVRKRFFSQTVQFLNTPCSLPSKSGGSVPSVQRRTSLN